MTARASFFYGLRLVFPRGGGAVSSNAVRSLRTSIVCIALSLVPLVCVLVMADGMIAGITDRITGLGSYHAQILFGRGTDEAETLDGLLRTASAVSRREGITAAYPELLGTGLAAGAERRVGATVRAVPEGMFRENPRFADLFRVEDGSASLESGQDGPIPCVIGSKLSEQLGISAGDRMRLILVSRTASGGAVPRMLSLSVRGVVSSGYQELDAMWVFVPIERTFSLLTERRVIIGIDTADPQSERLERICAALRVDYPRGALVYTWKQLNANQLQNLASTKIMLVFVMFMIVLVASVNISSSLVMLVMERRREIAILRSLGASAAGVRLCFLLAGFLCGGMGVLAGLPLGLALGVNINEVVALIEKAVNFAARLLVMLSRHDVSDFGGIRLLDPAYYLQGVPVSVPFRELLAVAAGTVLLSLAVSFVPALRAGRERPLDTLRKV